MQPIVKFLLWTLTNVPFAIAGYDPSSSNNIAVYWGQDSSSGTGNHRSLIDICRSEPHINIILLAFLVGASDVDRRLNFANSARPTEQQIIECQTQHNKTLILSLGGQVADNTWSFASPLQAVDAANRIYAAYGPAPPQGGYPTTTTRPFGSASVDGFDLDFEAPYANIDAMAQQLRTLINQAAPGRKLYLTAAPQCPFPDTNLGPVLQSTEMDMIFVQFYNNPICDMRAALTGGFAWSLGQWAESFSSHWAKSANGTARIFVGVPGAATAVSAENRASYADGAIIASQLLTKAQDLPSFAGVSIWDVSQLDTNKGFLEPIILALNNGSVGGSDGDGGNDDSDGNDGGRGGDDDSDDDDSDDDDGDDSSGGVDPPTTGSTTGNQALVKTAEPVPNSGAAPAKSGLYAWSYTRIGLRRAMARSR